jgi:formate dehydrogenase (NADP+) alpha subunit
MPLRVMPSSSAQKEKSMSKSNNNLIHINIDNQIYDVPKGLTILQAAETNGVYIPTLCAHQDLSPFGGCRMCVVEVDGIRGFPTSCTTPAEEGMVIRTNTLQLQALRQDVLQLILSEHPTNCLFCEETEECLPYMFTVRKGGTVTGCNSCPQNNQCELQDLTRRMGLEQLKFPFKYRNFPVELYDPFYDRDYNLCILCGRCIRECQEVRGANVLAFKQRGPHTIIGPAFERTHLEAGCEFCGACVAVCPTGTLSEKTSKWMGKPDGEVLSTCPLCSIGCQIRILIKNDEVIGSRPVKTSIVPDQLCVKGRFGLYELVNNYQRLKEPYHVQGKYRVRQTWDEALNLAASRLAECPPEEFGMLVSADCTNEDLYIAQKFTREVMHSNQIDTSVRRTYGISFNAYTDLLQQAASLSNLSQADGVLCIGLDTRYGRSVVGVELRKAIHRGAKVITIHPRQHNLVRVADRWIQSHSGEELSLLADLKALVGGGETGCTNPDIQYTADMLKSAAKSVILLGPEFISYRDAASILAAIQEIASDTHSQIIPLPAESNLNGSILMGCYPELQFGGKSFPVGKWNSTTHQSKMRVLYHMGEVPIDDTRQAEFEIFQNFALPVTPLSADLILPSAAFTEEDGTLISLDGSIQHLRKAIEPPGKAIPNWMILCRIAQAMGAQGFDFKTVDEIDCEIALHVEGFFGLKNDQVSHVPLKREQAFVLDGKGIEHQASSQHPFLLVALPDEDTFRGFPLTTWVKGLQSLLSEEILFISPEDAHSGNIASGDGVRVTSPGFEKDLVVRIAAEQPQGTLFLRLRQTEPIIPNPIPVMMRRKDV